MVLVVAARTTEMLRSREDRDRTAKPRKTMARLYASFIVFTDFWNVRGRSTRTGRFHCWNARSLGLHFAAWFMLEARARAVVGNVYTLVG